jgi:hypothetical protein
MYLNVFIFYFNVFLGTSSTFMVYFSVFIIYLTVYQCILMSLDYCRMYLNAFGCMHSILE